MMIEIWNCPGSEFLTLWGFLVSHHHVTCSTSFGCSNCKWQVANLFKLLWGWGICLLIADERKFDDATLEVDNPQEDSGVEESVEGGGSLSENNEEGSLGKEDSLTDENGGESTFSYERLKAKSTNPARGINYKQREVCALFILFPFLSRHDFCLWSVSIVDS